MPLETLIGSQAGITTIPVVGSTCLVIFRNNNISQPQILKVDQVDQLLINTNSTKFNNGNLGGMVKVVNLVSQLNNLENKLNNFIADYNIHTHSGVAVGLGMSGTILTEGTPIKLTVRTDIENTAIQQ